MTSARMGKTIRRAAIIYLVICALILVGFYLCSEKKGASWLGSSFRWIGYLPPLVVLLTVCLKPTVCGVLNVLLAVVVLAMTRRPQHRPAGQSDAPKSEEG